MAWTDEDRERLRSAYLALACGEKVQRVVFDGPPRREVTYHPVDLDKMRALLAEMDRQVTSAPTNRRVQWKKGFRDE